VSTNNFAMAQIRRLKEIPSNLTVIEVNGELTHGEFISFLESNRSVQDPSPGALFDFRSASLSSLSKQRIKEALADFQKFAQPGLRAALVFSDPADYSKGKTISKAISKHGYLSEIRGFYNLYLAKAWLLYRQPVYKPATKHRLVAF
ncbi:MAG: hypothetical protein KJN90_15515, partial [Gammaproteobacteria bacterium]|nr:hypothetical protein [Gammaproteobacteria bacterium]